MRIHPSCCVAFLAGSSLFAQYPTNAAKPSDALYQTMEDLDRQVFDAYNNCQLEKFAPLFDEKVEFYHDQGGVTVGSAKLVEQLKANICGKVRRELVAGSLKVYPMNGYGAVVMGVHRFYQKASGPEPTGIAQFVHLWENKGGAWKVTRVISYDHVGLKK